MMIAHEHEDYEHHQTSSVDWLFDLQIKLTKSLAQYAFQYAFLTIYAVYTLYLKITWK